jgi:hypothetical protein
VTIACAPSLWGEWLETAERGSVMKSQEPRGMLMVQRLQEMRKVPDPAFVQVMS